MILLIEAGGIRSSARLENSTVPVSASMMKACWASVSSPAPGGGGAGVGAPGLGLAGAVFVCGAGLVWAAAPIPNAAGDKTSAAASAVAIHGRQRTFIDAPAPSRARILIDHDPRVAVAAMDHLV